MKDEARGIVVIEDLGKALLGSRGLGASAATDEAHLSEGGGGLSGSSSRIVKDVRAIFRV